MASQRKGADASAEVLLCRDGVPPELLAAKLDALDSEARFALFDKKKNIAAVSSKLAEARAHERFNLTLSPQLCRTAPRRAAVPGGPCCNAWRADMLPSRVLAPSLRSDLPRAFPPSQEASKKGELSFALVRQLARTVPSFEDDENNDNECAAPTRVSSAHAKALSDAIACAAGRARSSSWRPRWWRRCLPPSTRCSSTRCATTSRATRSARTAAELANLLTRLAQEMVSAFVTLESLVAAAGGLVVLKGEGALPLAISGALRLTIHLRAHLRRFIHRALQFAICWARTSLEA